MQKFFKRLAAYVVDIFIINILATLVASISFINPQYADYTADYETYLELYSQRIEVMDDIDSAYEDQVISAEELDNLKNDYTYFGTEFDVLNDKTEVTQEDIDGLKESITNSYNDQFYDINYSLEKNMMIYNVIYIVMIIIYFGLLPIFTNGQTIGKRLLRLKVVTKDGKDAGFVRYTVRSLILYQSVFTIIQMILVGTLSVDNYYTAIDFVTIARDLVYYVILFMVMVRIDGRGLHDFIAGTKVVMLDREGNVLPDETYAPVEKTEEGKKETKSEKDAKKKYQKDDVQDALVEEVNQRNLERILVKLRRVVAEGRVKMMNKIRLALYRFFMGRNGADDLYRASFLFYLILFVISLFVRSTVLNVILLVLAIWIVFRALSKNIPARRRENKAYLKVKNRISRFFDMVGRRFRDRDSHFIKDVHIVMRCYDYH